MKNWRPKTPAEVFREFDAMRGNDKIRHAINIAARESKNPSLTLRDISDRRNSRAANDRERVLNLLRTNPNGLTDREMQSDLSLAPKTQKERRAELVRAGTVRNSGETRRTKSGQQSIVWKAEPESLDTEHGG